MATKTLEEFRKMAPDLLREREEELRTELFKLRTGNSTEKVKNTSQFKKIKKDVARIETILREKELKTTRQKA